MLSLGLAKLNRDLYALTFVRNDKPPTSMKISKKRKSFNYKQYERRLREGGEMPLNNAQVKEQCPAAADILDSLIAKFITLATNYCGYGGAMEYMIVNYFHPLSLKTKVVASLEDNSNWREVTTGFFLTDIGKK